MIDVIYGVREATLGGTLIMKVLCERLADVPCRLPLLPAFRSFFEIKKWIPNAIASGHYV